jgi:hypothetical protein
MADVTISQLTPGVPAGNNLLAYSTGSNTLGVPVSAMFQNTECVAIGTTTPLTFTRLHIQAPQETNLFQSTSVTQHQLNSHLNGNGANLYCGVEGSSSGRTDVTGTLDNASYFGSRTAHATQFITNNSAKMTISSAGYVTIPYQPIFRVSMTGGGGNQGNTIIKVPFNYALVNVGGHYSLTDKQFNVPVDGNYHFTAGHMNSQNNSGTGIFEIRKNNVRQCYVHNNNSHPMSTSWSIILQCNKGDYIDMWASNYHFGGQAESGYDYPTLMGYLIG